MNSFGHLVESIVTEKPGDEGLEISPQAEGAYAELLKLYDGVVAESFEEDLDRPGRLGAVREFLDDVPRTIVMLRAMHRAVLARLKEGAREVDLVEAGCGAGLLAVAGAAMDSRVRVRAFDRGASKVGVTRFFAGAMGFGDDRVRVEELDLTTSNQTIRADVLVAEHISRGLLRERAVQVPRAVDVDPQYVVPYAVQPAFFQGFEVRVQKKPWGLAHTYLGRGPVAHLGQEIVLADRSSSDSVTLAAEIEIPPGVSPIMVGNDIIWLSPLLGGDLFRQSPRDFPAETDPDLMRNHLLGPTLLPGVTPLDDLSRLHMGRYWGFENHGRTPEVGRVSIHYPIGFAGAMGFEDPRVVATGFSSTSLVKETALFYSRSL